MNRQWTISTVLRYATYLLFAFAIFGLGDDMNRLFGFHLDLLVQGEIWRLVTWPIGLSFGGLIMAAIGFSQPGEEIEQMLGGRRFGLALLAVVGVVLVLHILASLYRPMLLAGPGALGLFALTGYYYLYPDSSIGLLFFRVSTKIVLLVALLATIGLGIGFSIDRGTIEIFSHGLPGALLGALYFHGLYGSNDRMPELPRWMRRGEASRSASIGRRDDPVIDDAQRADELLEKIARDGVDSLSKKEKAFLEQYSRRL